jgi:P2-related tail formation protein
MVSIDNASFIEFLNPAVKGDHFFVNAGRSLDPLLADIQAQTPNNVILAGLQNQTSATLDFIALYHFNLRDVWDLSYSKSQKLAFLKSAIEDKVLWGTPYAMKKCLSIAFNAAKVIEWFDDSPVGPHDTFRILINDPLIDPNRVTKLVNMIIKKKNARTYLAGLYTFTAAPTDIVYIGGSVAEYDRVILPYTPTYA